MTDDQKMVRFRNALKKKASNEGTSRSTRAHSMSEDLGHSDEDSSMSDDYDTAVETKLYKILSWFDQSHRLVQFDFKFIEDLVSYHNNSSAGSITRSSWMGHMAKLESLFREFAKLNEDFARIGTEDVRLFMLDQNCPLFVQFVLAMYFGHDEGHKQIHFLLGRQAPSLGDLTLRKVTMTGLDEDLSLFKNRGLAKPYEDLVHAIRMNHCSKPQIIALMAHVILVRNGPTNKLWQEAIESFPSLLKELGIREPFPEAAVIVENCQTMADYFKYTIDDSGRTADLDSSILEASAFKNR